MKNNLLFLITLVVTLLLSSCNGNVDHDSVQKEPNVEEFLFTYSDYYGDVNQNLTHVFDLQLTDFLTIQRKSSSSYSIYGSGALYVLRIVSESNVQINPALGTYLSDNESGSAYSVDLSRSQCNIYKDDVLEDEVAIANAQIEIKDDSLHLVLKLVNGETISASALNTKLFQDQRGSVGDDYYYEMNRKDTLHMVFDELIYLNNGDLLNVDADYWEFLAIGDHFRTYLVVFTERNSDSYVGVYPISMNLQPMTALYSIGRSYGGHQPCQIGYNFKNGNKYDVCYNFYYLLDGEITIQDGSLTFEAISAYGSLITGEFEGDFIPYKDWNKSAITPMIKQ